MGLLDCLGYDFEMECLLKKVKKVLLPTLTLSELYGGKEKEPPTTRKKIKKCPICGTILSIYNSGEKCFLHSRKC